MKMRDVSFKVYALIIGFALLQILAPVQVLGAESKVPSVPTLTVPAQGWTTTSSKPLLRGVTNNDTRVAVYIDDVFNGFAEVKNASSGTASFAYEPFLPLGDGYHRVKVRAEKTDGTRSEASAAVKFLVEEPYPAPTLFAPVVNKKTVSTKPFVVGLVKNNSLVKVFIDGQLDGQFWVKEAGSAQTVDFSYKPFLPLDPKEDHLVYATASDADGKESAFSNVEGFRVRAPKPVVNTTAATSSSSETKTDVAPTDESTDTVGDTETKEETANTPATENTTPSTDNATPADTSANQSTEVKDEDVKDEDTQGEETNNETENSGEEQSTSDNKEEVAETDSAAAASATDADDQKQDRSWIIWVIIIILILIILFRGRGDIQRRMQGGSSMSTNDNDAVKKALDKINPSQPTGEKSSSGEKKDESSSPPPPPASSSY